MITLLTGENSFEISRTLDTIVNVFQGVAEKFDGSDLTLSQLPDLLLGGTLFATERLIIVRDLSDNKQLWDALPDWLGRIGDDMHFVLVEPKPDKRTKAYKDIKKLADVKEFTLWSDRDAALAETWVLQEAKRQGLDMDKKSAHTLVARVGMDQWQLYHALEKLAVLKPIDATTIDAVIEAQPSENVFNLLDAALSGNMRRVSDMTRTLQRTQDPYMTFGLLSGQVFQLAALAVSDKPANQLAGAIGAHPFALSKLAPYAKKLGRSGTRRLVRIFADTDALMKSTPTDPWILVEQALMKTAQ